MRPFQIGWEASHRKRYNCCLRSPWNRSPAEKPEAPLGTSIIVRKFKFVKRNEQKVSFKSICRICPANTVEPTRNETNAPTNKRRQNCHPRCPTNRELPCRSLVALTMQVFTFPSPYRNKVLVPLFFLSWFQLPFSIVLPTQPLSIYNIYYVKTAKTPSNSTSV